MDELEDFNEKVKTEFEETLEKEKTEPTKEDLIELLSEGIFKREDTHEKDKVIDILFNEKDKRKIADITANQLIDFSVMLTCAKDLKSPTMFDFIDNLLTLSYSKDRKSRGEVVQIYQTDLLTSMGGFGGFPLGLSNEPPKQPFYKRIAGRFGFGGNQ